MTEVLGSTITVAEGAICRSFRLTNEKRVLRILTNERRVLRILTNEKRVLGLLTNERRVFTWPPCPRCRGSSWGRQWTVRSW